MSELDLKLDANDGAGQVILCPICGFQYNHGFDENGMASVLLFEGEDDYKAGWTGRGDLLVIQMTCEEEHQWEMCIGFHKGTMHAFARSGHSRKE
jgi:hypothetical protein